MKDLLIDPTWNSVSAVIGASASRLAKPVFTTDEKPLGDVTLTVIPGRPNQRRCASA